eukprot:3064208-Rhodomonas_salina.1
MRELAEQFERERERGREREGEQREGEQRERARERERERHVKGVLCLVGESLRDISMVLLPPIVLWPYYALSGTGTGYAALDWLRNVQY